MFKAVASDFVSLRRTNKLCAYLSTEKIQSFRSAQDDPANHSVKNIAQFYKISPEVKNQLFMHGGIPKSYKIQTKTFTETCLMIREPAMDLINCMKAIDFNKPVVRFVLYGNKGTGKSLTIANILHYGHEAGFLLVHVPWVGEWMRRSKENSNSLTREGFVDINLDAAAWLIHFKTQNAHLLLKPELVTSERYEWSKREVTEKGSTLLQLIDLGVSRVKYASECVVALCKEIKMLSRDGKCRTLVAVDGFNAFFYANTRVYTEKKEMVGPSKVTLTQAFVDITKNDWTNGVCVLSVDEIAIAEKDQISHFPRYLLGKTGFEHLDPFVPIEVNNYSAKEFTSCMDYYRERRWVQPVHGQDEELSFLSASNPYKLMQLCGPL